jgi:hypothetical protein
MSITFPSNPSLNQTYTNNGDTWTYNGTAWDLQATSTTSSGATVTVSNTAPGNPTSGALWIDSDYGDLNAYFGNSWVIVGGGGGGVPQPIIANVVGGIYTTVSSTITIYGTSFGLAQGTLRYSFGNTIVDQILVPISNTFITTQIPSGIFNLSANVAGNISWIPAIGSQSNGYVMSVNSNPYPTGGVITTSGGYRIHTFTTSGSFTVTTSGFPSTVEALIVAGGGGGGRWGGGGGAGGLLYYGTETPKSPNGGAITVTPQTYTITVGSGGAGHVGDAQSGGNGGSGTNSIALGYTAIGGGGGGNYGQSGTPGPGLTGGSSGGGGSNGPNYNGTTRGNTATTPATGQGFAGGLGGGNYGTGGSGGGGGSGAVGKDYNNALGPLGGDGLAYSISGVSVYYAGGGAGVNQGTSTLYGPSLGGGGRGGGGPATSLTSAQVDGQTNTGGGGGGTQDGVISGTTRAGNGGSGIVIIRYAI